MVYWGTFGECPKSPAAFPLISMPMNHPFAEHLPWRVAALAGLLVGGISLATGAEVWTCLLRVGGAFLLFALIGLGLRAALQQGAVPPAATGRRFDRTTAEDASEETGSPAAPNASDANSDILK